MHAFSIIRLKSTHVLAWHKQCPSTIEKIGVKIIQLGTLIPKMSPKYLNNSCKYDIHQHIDTHTHVYKDVCVCV